MASTPLSRVSTAQGSDRNNRSASSYNSNRSSGNGNSSNSSRHHHSGSSAGNTKTTTPLTDKEGTVSFPIRSASERRNALLRSGLIRGGNASFPASSSAGPTAAVRPVERVSSEGSERCSRQVKPDAPLIAKAGAGGVAERQQRTSTRQEQGLSLPVTPSTPAPQASKTSAGEDGTIRLSSSQTERARDGSERSNAETGTAVATAAFLASSATVPPQLLAPVGAAACTPYADLSTVFLVCGCGKEESGLQRGPSLPERGVTASSAALLAGSFDQQVRPQAQQVRPGGELGRYGKVQLQGMKGSTATLAKTAVAAVVDNGRLRQECHVLQTSSAEASDAPVMIGGRGDATIHRPGAASTSLVDRHYRATSLPPHRRRQCSGDPYEATAADALSAALWRTVTSSPSGMSYACREDDVLQLQLHHREQRERLQDPNTLLADEERERRLKQRDARFIAGCLQAALAAASATALRVAVSQRPNCCRRGTESPTHAVTSAERQRHHGLTNAVNPYAFCLPCAATRYNHKVPSLSAVAAASFVLSRHRWQEPPQASELTHATFSVGCCDGVVEARRKTLMDDTSSSSNCYITVYPNGLATGSAASVRHRAKGEARNGNCRRGSCVGYGSGDGGYGYCSKRDGDWTCRAVYIHLGMLYTAADVAASATAAAAGKKPRDGRTTAAAARATHITEGRTVERQALGSVLLRRALVSSVATPLRAAVLLQQRQAQQVEQRCSGLQQDDLPEQAHVSLLPTASAARTQQIHINTCVHASTEVADTRDPCLPADRDVHSYLASIRNDKRCEEERRGEDEEEEVGCGCGTGDTDCVTVCCFDGIEQLQVHQWQQAAEVLSCALSDIVKAAAVSIAQTRAVLHAKQKRASNSTALAPSAAQAAADTERVGGSVATNVHAATALGNPVANTTVEDRKTQTTVGVNSVVFLLLWRSKHVPLDDCAKEAGSTAATMNSQKGLWEEISRWQQQVRRTCPGVQVLLLSGEEEVESRAYSYMLWYLTQGRFCVETKRSSADTARQQQVPDPRSTEVQRVQSVLKQEPWQGGQEPEAQVHQQAEKQQWRREGQSRQADAQWQQQGKLEHREVAREASEDVQQGKEAARYDQQLNGDARGAEGSVSCAQLSGQAKQRTSGAAGASLRPVTEQAARDRTHRHRHEASLATEVRRGDPKKAPRPCMLFLCGCSFMAAPLLSEGHLWRQTSSWIPGPLQHFVHELENYVYMPMVLRSRLCAPAGVRPAALGQTEAAAGRTSGIATPVAQRRSVLLKAQCERLLRWGDELLPPPRVLVHSCDLRNRQRHARWDSSGPPTQYQWPAEHGAAVSCGGLSPQQLLQLVGEKYSRDVQTFLLPVAALASSFVGETENRLRRLLREAAAAAPAVLVLLGLDQLAARRQFHQPPACKQLRAQTHQRRAPLQEKKQVLSDAVSRHNVAIEKLRQEDQSRRDGRQHESGAEREDTASRADDCEQGELLTAARATNRERSSGDIAGDLRHITHIAGRVSAVRTGYRALDEGASTAESRRTTTTRSENTVQHGTSDNSESESTEEDEESDGDQLPIESRSGAAAASALRRRLLAALLVGLDDIEDRRSSRSAVLSVDDPSKMVTAGETEEQDAADATAARHAFQQQAGLAVVGVCGGRPESLDEAVVRAGRLDVWLSWPQVMAA